MSELKIKETAAEEDIKFKRRRLNEQRRIKKRSFEEVRKVGIPGSWLNMTDDEKVAYRKYYIIVLD